MYFNILFQVPDLHKIVTYKQSIRMLRAKALQTPSGFDSTLWDKPFKDEIQKVTGRTAWTSMYSFIRAACCPDDVWSLCLKLLDAWDTYKLKGLKAPADKKPLKNRAVPKALMELARQRPKTKMSKNPKRFPHSTFEKLFTGIPMDASKLLIKKLLKKEISFLSVAEVRALFVLLLCCCMCTFTFCFVSVARQPTETLCSFPGHHAGRSTTKPNGVRFRYIQFLNG
jgi:hypothetical protein